MYVAYWALFPLISQRIGKSVTSPSVENLLVSVIYINLIELYDVVRGLIVNYRAP